MINKPMNVVCLGWGSLVWEPRELPVSGLGCWGCDGPVLPVEFVRESSDGRITLVITKGVSSVTVLWCNLLSANIDEARRSLAEREGISEKHIECSIGFWSPDKNSAHVGVEAVEVWAQLHDVKAVVWTALKPGLKTQRGVIPDIEEIVAHISNLSADARLKAEEYVRKAPPQICTHYRMALEKKFSWTPHKPHNVQKASSLCTKEVGF